MLSLCTLPVVSQISNIYDSDFVLIPQGLLLDYYDVPSLARRYRYASSNSPLDLVESDVAGWNEKFGPKCKAVSSAFDAQCCETADDANLELKEFPYLPSTPCKDVHDEYFKVPDGDSCCGQGERHSNTRYWLKREFDRKYNTDADLTGASATNADISAYVALVQQKFPDEEVRFYWKQGSYISSYCNNPTRDPACAPCPNGQCPTNDASFGILGVIFTPKCMITKTCNFTVDNWVQSGFQYKSGGIQVGVHTGKVLRGQYRVEDRDTGFHQNDPLYSPRFFKVESLSDNKVAGYASNLFLDPYGFYAPDVITAAFSDVAHLSTLRNLVHSYGVDLEARFHEKDVVVVEKYTTMASVSVMARDRSVNLAVVPAPVFANGTLIPLETPELMDDYTTWFIAFFKKQGFSLTFLEPVLRGLVTVMKADDPGPFPPFAAFKDQFDSQALATKVPVVDFTDVAIVFEEVVNVLQNSKDSLNAALIALASAPGSPDVTKMYQDLKSRLLSRYNAMKNEYVAVNFFQKKLLFPCLWLSGSPHMLVHKERRSGKFDYAFHKEEDVIGYFDTQNLFKAPGVTWPVPAENESKLYDSLQALYESLACKGYEFGFDISFGGTLSCP